MSFLIRDTFSILSQRLYNNRRAQHESCPHTVFRVPLFFTTKPPRNTDINLQYKFYSSEVNAQRCCDSKQPTNPHWRRTSCILCILTSNTLGIIATLIDQSFLNKIIHKRVQESIRGNPPISPQIYFRLLQMPTYSCTFLKSERTVSANGSQLGASK